MKLTARQMTVIEEAFAKADQADSALLASPNLTAAQALPLYDAIRDRQDLRRALRQQARPSRYRAHVINLGGRVFTRNNAGRCEDAPCCGCCTI